MTSYLETTEETLQKDLNCPKCHMSNQYYIWLHKDCRIDVTFLFSICALNFSSIKKYFVKNFNENYENILK